MILHTLPDPDETREQLQSVTDVIWAALEHGLVKTREYFEQEGTEIDPWLAANITRYHARIHLEDHQADASYGRVELLNCGLRVVTLRDGRYYDVWIKKSDDGDLPVPQSYSMLAFYHQPVMIGFYLEQSEAVAVTDSLSLMLLWETPKSYTHIASLMLVLPAQGGESKSDVQAHWSIAVPHPMTTAVAAEPISAEEEEAEDLPISENPSEATGDPDDEGEE